MARHGARVLHNFISAARVDELVEATLRVSEQAHHNVNDTTTPNQDVVAQVLDGTYDGVRRLAMEPGSLVLFKGRCSIHRVTPIEGKTARPIALSGYDTTPGVLMSESARLRRFGRVA